MKNSMQKIRIIALIAVILAAIFCLGYAMFSNSKDREATSEVVEDTATQEDSIAEDVSAQEDSATEEASVQEDESASEEASPLLIWEYEGYVDECAGYLWKDEFADCDYDGDGLQDRLSRKWNGEEEIALYTIEFGNGDVLNVPKGWETGFPHVQSGDLDGDGAKEILVTLTYDTSTYPCSFGDMWLFDKDSSGEYKEVSLPLASGENGAKGFTVDYEAPEGNEIRYTLEEAGMSRSEKVDEDFISSWWTNEAFSEIRPVFWAEVREEATPVIRCFVNPIARSTPILGFNLSYRNGEYEIGYIEIDEPQNCPF